MIVEITSACDAKQQRPVFTEQAYSGIVFRHFRLLEANEGDDTLGTIKELLRSDALGRNIVWLDDEAFCCRPHQAFYFLRSFFQYKVLHDVAVCAPAEQHAAAATVILAGLSDPDVHMLQIKPVANAPIVSSLTHHQLQAILQGGRHFLTRRPVRFDNFCFTAEQTHALMTCDSEVELSVGSCWSSNWNLDALMGRTTCFGNLSISVTPFDATTAPTCIFVGNEWNRFLRHLQQRPGLLFDTFAINRLESASVLELLSVQDSFARLRLHSCLESAQGAQVLAQAIKEGQTPGRLNISNKHDVDGFNYVHVIEALASPQCSLVEFGMMLGGEELSSNIKTKLIEALQKNRTLQQLTFEGPAMCGFVNHDLELAQAIRQHPSLHCISFEDFGFEDEDTKTSCLPALKHLLESNRNFCIKWTQFAISEWWNAALFSVRRFQQLWRGAWDAMPILPSGVERRKCFQLVLRACSDNGHESNNEYRWKVIGLLLSNNMSILKHGLENGMLTMEPKNDTRRELNNNKRMKLS